MKRKLTQRSVCIVALFLLAMIMPVCVSAQSDTPLRRPISPSSPVWIVHIDTWVYADPLKCIEEIPEDIRPFVVMNLSLSVSDFVRKEYPFTIVESWIRTCAEYGMWAMIQPSSGGPSNFSDTELEVYEYFYTNYPNFVGWNFCEQNWGFGIESVSFETRLKLFTHLLKLGDKYGGYLVMSTFLPTWGADSNPVARLKRDADFAEACKAYQKNTIVCEKYTASAGFYDVESANLGVFLSGYAGNYGIRFDECGWESREGIPFPTATGIVPILEHFMLTGETVTDGPELTWRQTILMDGTSKSPDGYTSKKLKVAPQFTNISIDIFRKILDGSVRIPTREEVIDRTKIVFVNDVTTGTAQEQYSTEPSLFTGLYGMDGEFWDNFTWFKKTGRYPSIPMVHKEGDYETGDFEVVIKKSEYAKRWPTIQKKVDEFNELFPSEYTGDLYAARMNNNWMTYNPYMDDDKVATAVIPLQYNTCEEIELAYSQYTSGVINEFEDKLQFYLNNYRIDDTRLREDIIKVYGSTVEPTYTYADRADHAASIITKTWENGVFTLTVKHNGPLDITINCAGSSTDKRTDIATAAIVAPAAPSPYMGPRQYEAEDFEYKDIQENVTAAHRQSVRDYTAMGFLSFGTNSTAAIRKNINVLRKGSYLLKTRYQVTGMPVTNIDLYVNGEKVASPRFIKTTGWGVQVETINLRAGKNIIEFKASRNGSSNIFFDNIIIEDTNTGVYDFSNDEAATVATTPAAQLITVQSGTAGVVAYTDAAGQTDNCFKAYTAGAVHATGVADLDMFPVDATDYSVVWKEYYTTTGASKGILLRAAGECTYAEGMKQGYLFVTRNNNDNTVTLETQVAGEAGIALKQTYKSTFTVEAGKPCWYRATVVGEQLIFECSADSIQWEGETVTDATYLKGSTQLIWGMEADNLDWVMDNITYSQGSLSVSNFLLEGFKDEQDTDVPTVLSFVVAGNSLADNVSLTSSGAFEISLREDAGFTSSLTLMKEAGKLSATTVYARMKSGLDVGLYSGEILVTSKGVDSRYVSLQGEILPKAVFVTYDFTDDKASNRATTPPAIGVTVSKGNTATAGVVSYTDANGVSSNMLKAYSAGPRNGTGVLNLNLFSRKATDYSVTWKQCLGSTTSEYKIGVLLRGDTANIGGSNTGYVQGIMQGYLFIVYVTPSQNKSEFRIYKSTSAYNTLDMKVNSGVDGLLPSAKQPMWYRASASGSSRVELTFEYSTDSLNWNTAATLSDFSLPFESGATQVVWGLAGSQDNFYLDNITFHGITGETNSIGDVIADGSATVVREEYYTLMGQRVLHTPGRDNLKGIYIVKRFLSNGTVDAQKVYFK